MRLRPFVPLGVLSLLLVVQGVRRPEHAAKKAVAHGEHHADEQELHPDATAPQLLHMQPDQCQLSIAGGFRARTVLESLLDHEAAMSHPHIQNSGLDRQPFRGAAVSMFLMS